MPAKQADFTMTAGDYRQLEFEVRKPPTPIQKQGDIVNLAGYTAKWVLSTSARGSVLVEKNSTKGITIPNPANGKVVVEILKEDTIDFTGTLYHELEITDGAARNVTVAYGTVNILPSAIN